MNRDAVADLAIVVNVDNDAPDVGAGAFFLTVAVAAGPISVVLEKVTEPF